MAHVWLAHGPARAADLLFVPSVSTIPLGNHLIPQRRFTLRLVEKTLHHFATILLFVLLAIQCTTPPTPGLNIGARLGDAQEEENKILEVCLRK